MAPPDWSVLVCPECGAANRAGETACFLCGHRLDTTWSEGRTGVRDSRASTTSPVKPKGAADAFSASRPTFRISSLMLLIAVVAVCAGVSREQPVLGFSLAVAVTPAVLYTAFAALKGAAEGRPMAVFEKVWSFLAALAGVVVIALAGLIAFAMICIPAGFVAFNANVPENSGLIVALVIGGAAGVAAAAYTTYLLLTRKRRIARRAGKP